MPSSFQPFAKEASNCIGYSDYAVGKISGQKRNGRFHAIYYASKVLNGAQINYSQMEKEMIVVVDAPEKF